MMPALINYSSISLLNDGRKSVYTLCVHHTYDDNTLDDVQESKYIKVWFYEIHALNIIIIQSVLPYEYKLMIIIYID